ncbi:ABC transporter substrate-binding protein [Ottowia thiooxydans]|uniref:ABC transport system substrate-binding protein n=1 Tax=Ottowia thiooxydans TaxID=219182 RepID=A0ABV2Q8K9_9BURK
MQLKQLLGAAAITLASAAFAQAPTPKIIAIASFGEHPALNQVAEGFKARMTQLGYVEGRQVTYDFMHANFDRSLVPQILQRAEAKKPDLIFAITTPLNQAAVRGIKDKSIPIVFGSVVDPVVAGLVPDWQHGSAWSSGATILQDFEASLAFVKQVVPTVKRVGTLYNPGEDNDKTNIDLYNKAARKVGLEVVAVPVDNANDIPQRAQSFAGKVDAIYQIQSNIVQTSIPVVAQVARRNRIPLFNSVYSEQLKHQLAGFHAVSYTKNGEHAADIANRILKGEKPANIAPYVPKASDFDALISPQGLQAVGLSVPSTLANSPWILK